MNMIKYEHYSQHRHDWFSRSHQLVLCKHSNTKFSARCNTWLFWTLLVLLAFCCLWGWGWLELDPSKEGWLDIDLLWQVTCVLEESVDWGRWFAIFDWLDCALEFELSSFFRVTSPDKAKLSTLSRVNGCDVTEDGAEKLERSSRLFVDSDEVEATLELKMASSSLEK